MGWQPAENLVYDLMSLDIFFCIQFSYAKRKGYGQLNVVRFQYQL